MQENRRKMPKKRRKTRKKFPKLLKIGEYCVNITVEICPNKLLNEICLNKKREVKPVMARKEIIMAQACKENQAQNLMEEKAELNKLNLDLIELTNYLISLFYATGKKYSCTRTKISKLMSIVAFAYARKNEILFEDKIDKYDGCGTVIIKIKSNYDIDMYLNVQYADNREQIREEINFQSDIPAKYMNSNNLDACVKKEIDKVFVNFGAYTARDLGQCIDKVINFPNVINNGTIDLSVISVLKKEDFSGVTDNRELIDYLF